MYTILIEENNTLYASQTQRIMQRSKLVDVLTFLVAPTYGDLDMSQCTAILEYVTAKNKYRTEFLTLDSELYKGYLQYKLPVDTFITEEAGETKLQLTFSFVDLDEQGNSVQRVRKTGSHTINVIPVIAWSDIIPDEALSALDQRIIKLDAQTKALNEMNDILAQTKADDISIEKDKIQLMANGQKIGSIISVASALEDGTPVVDLDSSTGKPVEPEEDNNGCNCGDDVVEFDDVPPATNPDGEKDVVEF